MQNNKTVLSILAALVIGVFAGYLIWGGQATQIAGTHMMPNGSAMPSMMANMNASLQGRAGDAFDREFLAEMIVHHQGAVQMAQLALTSAKHQEIKDLAQGIINAQNNEITEMKAWQKNWYNQ